MMSVNKHFVMAIVVGLLVAISIIAGFALMGASSDRTETVVVPGNPGIARLVVDGTRFDLWHVVDEDGGGECWVMVGFERGGLSCVKTTDGHR